MSQQSPKPLPSRAAAPSGHSFAAEEPQWYLISEDRSLCLRIVSGAVVCEGEDGELVISADNAAHSARFDISDDLLWLSCLTGHIRADGRVVAQPLRLESGVQLHMGRTRYFIAEEINEPAPEVPVLDSPLASNDTRLPKPSQRHIPVFYSGPLQVEEILITETAEVLNSDPSKRTADPDLHDSSKASQPSRASHARRQGPAQHNNLPAILLTAGLLTSGLLTSDLLKSGGTAPLLVSGHVFETQSDADVAQRISADYVSPPAIATAVPLHDSDSDAVVVDLTHLAWADQISPENHRRLIELTRQLEQHIRTQTIREAIDHYARRLIREVTSATDLESMLAMIGPVLAPYTEYRPTLAALEQRIVDLSRTSDPPSREQDPQALQLVAAELVEAEDRFDPARAIAYRKDSN